MLALVSLLFAFASVTGTAAEPDPDARRLAERFAPVFALQVREEPCGDTGEAFEPASVDVVLGNPQILLRQVSDGNPVRAAGAGAPDLFDLGEGFFLDFPGDALSPGCLYEWDFARYRRGRNPVVYAHIARQADEPGLLALQYWFYWYYNDWNNRHESDWEGIQLLFEADDPAAALGAEPASVGYAQHEGGERAHWGDRKLERRGTRPVVYSSTGSHASYFDSGLHLGRGATEGFGCDDTSGPSRTVDPHVVLLPSAVDARDDPFAWLAFEGHWGELHGGPFNGPTGPAMKDRWNRPVDWDRELRPSSVLIPGGASAAPSLVSTFCGAVEGGSGVLMAAQRNPSRMLAVLVILLASIAVAARRTDWGAVRPLPIRRRRRLGQIAGAALHLYRSRPATFVSVGLVYLPIALVVAALAGVAAHVPVLGALLDTDRGLGLAGVFVTVLVGGLGHTVGFAASIAIVADLMRRLELDERPPGGAAFAGIGPRLGALRDAVAGAVAIVALLLASVVGIPWGLRQLVRYQFVPQATALDDVRGGTARNRSARLVRGRWFHTALAMSLANLLVGAVATAVGLVMLVWLTALPLWLFSGIAVLALGVVVPYAAIGAVLLYGDAVAEADGLGTAQARAAHAPVAPAGAEG